MFRGEATQFLSWTPGDEPKALKTTQSLDYISTDAARILIMTNTGTWDKTDMHPDERYPPRQVNVTECQLYNATYSVDFSFEFPTQFRSARILDWLNPVKTYHDPSESSDQWPNFTLSLLSDDGLT